MEGLGGRLALDCPPGCRIFVQGPLGAGKTTLVRGFIRALGFTGTVKSPTYTLVESYFLEKDTVYHFDFYRIAFPEELESIGLRDYFDRSAICLIEWPEKAGPLLGAGDLQIIITLCEPGREVVLLALSPVGMALINSLS
jgi:tRNA threonylcarbamoyladenosine biosynthesis protein TsaE